VSVLRLMENLAPGALSQFGGHHLSGGFEVDIEKVHTLEEEFEKSFIKMNELPVEEEPVLLDGKLGLSDVNYGTWKIIEKLEPFGTGNPKPAFLFENIEIEKVEKFGKQKNHLKLVFMKNEFDRVNAIAFYAKEDSYKAPISPGKKINLVANIERSLFRNFPELRLRIVDIF